MLIVHVGNVFLVRNVQYEMDFPGNFIRSRYRFYKRECDTFDKSTVCWLNINLSYN